MSFIGVYEQRSLPYLALSNIPITADEEICQISGDIKNNEVTFASFQAAFAELGKLYVVDENGNSMYITDANQDYPAKFQILSTIMIEKDKVLSLRYSANTTLYNLIVVIGGSVF